MTCADRDIILLNKRLDRETRRDVFIPTQISGVSVYDNRQSSKDSGFHKDSETFKIRIPIGAQVQDGRTYIPETHYDALSDSEAREHWTIHNEDLIILSAYSFGDVNISAFGTDAVTMQQAEEFAHMAGFQKEIISIADYSDNTLRGSRSVRHWRIGGA